MTAAPSPTLVSWTARVNAECDTDQELYAMLVEFAPDELKNVLVYRGDHVESGVTALARLHGEYGE